MKKLYIFFWLVSCITNLNNAQTEKVNLKYYQSISPEASQIIDQLSDIENKKDSGAIILFREAKMIVEKNGLFKSSYHLIGRLFDNNAVADYSQIPISFNSYYEDINLDFARTIDTDKSFINISKDAIQIKTSPDYYGSINYTDTKILAFSLPALGKGKLFEYQITIKEKRHRIRNHWFGTYIFNLVLYNLNNPYYLRVDSVLTSRFLLTVPKGFKFQTELNNINIPVEKSTLRNNDIYLWEASNLSPIFVEEGMPYLYEVIPKISVSSLSDWKEFGKEVFSDFSKRGRINDAIKLKAKELTSNAEINADKIKLLYNYVRKEINYIQADLDRGGLIPHYSDEVLKNKYGDCKDQVTLLISLLNAEGIEAYPALVSTFSYRDHQNHIPSQYFDHVIAYIRYNWREIWLDPTSEVNVFPSLHWNNQNRWAFVLNEEGGNFIETPTSKAEDNVGIFNITIKSYRDNLEGQVQLLCEGAIMENLFYYLNSFSIREQESMIRDLIQSYYSSISVSKIDIREALNNRDFYSQVINFNYLESTKSLWYFTYATNISIAFSTFFAELPLFEKDQKRNYDYRFPCKYTLKGTEVYYSPWKNSSDVEIPNDDSLRTENFYFRQNFKKFDDSVRVTWVFTLLDDKISPDQTESFNDDVKKLEKMVLWQINFYKGSSYFLNKIPTTTKVIFGLLFITFSIFSLIMLIDAYKKEPRERNWIWLSIIFATGPLGSTVYYFTKKRPRDKQRTETLEELYCSDCGEKVKIEDKFCPKCGSAFNEKELISNEEINYNEAPEWLWNVYPLFILLISYLVNVNNFSEGDTDRNIGRV
ncbi:MAG: DUF3857 domain-containing protein, partial [Ignavibacteriaceae bacterium]